MIKTKTTFIFSQEIADFADSRYPKAALEVELLQDTESNCESEYLQSSAQLSISSICPDAESSSIYSESLKVYETKTRGKSPKIDATVSLKLSNFTIDWTIIPHDIFKTNISNEMTHRCGLKDADINRLTDHIVSQMRRISSKIPIATFRKVAADATRRYPVLLDLDDDGALIGDGSGSFTEKLKNRNSYLNRPHKEGLQLLHRKLGQDSNRQCRVGVRKEYTTCGDEHSTESENLKEYSTWTQELLIKSKNYMRYKMDNTDLTVRFDHRQRADVR